MEKINAVFEGQHSTRINTKETRTPYVRRLSAVERYNLVINELVRYNLNAIAEGDGYLDADLWQRALDRAASANPGVRVRLKSFLGLSKWVDSGIAPRVSVIDAPEWDGNSEVGAEFLSRGFDVINGDPACEVLLIQGRPARVIFRAVHAVTDARGLQHFILDVFRALRGEALLGSTSTLTDLDVQKLHQDKVTATEAAKIRAIPAMPIDTADIGPSVNYVWRRITIPENVPNMLPKMAVFLAAQARRHGQGDVAFTIPIDFRGLRTEVRSTANLTGYIRVIVEAQDSPRSVMKKIHRSIKDYEDCRIPGYINVVPWLPVQWLRKHLAGKINELLYTTTDSLPTGGIVSLGLFEPEKWSYPGFSAKRIFGIPGSVGKLNVVIMNYTDSVQVIFSTPQAYNTRGQLERLITGFKQYIMS